MKGYQADIDFNNTYTGQIYEERGRGFLAMRGQAVYVPDGDGVKPRVIGNLQQSPDELKAIIKQNDWNQVHLIARGNTIMQILNGAVTSVVVDDDTKGRVAGRTHRLPDARRRADESRVPQHLAEEAL